MRKLYATILSAAICLAVSGAPAWASEHQSTLSAGYLHASTNVSGSDDLNGINVKSTATTKASEAATSARDASASKEAAKSSETNASSSA
ncbi:Ail/Lom family outer membrane beta-barrel protein, partial [Escherichia coli]